MANPKNNKTAFFAVLTFIIFSCNNETVNNKPLMTEDTHIVKCKEKTFSTFFTYVNLIHEDSVVITTYSDSTFNNKVSTMITGLINKQINVPENDSKLWRFSINDSLDSRYCYEIKFKKTNRLFKLSNLQVGETAVVAGEQTLVQCILLGYTVNGRKYSYYDQGAGIQLW